MEHRPRSHQRPGQAGVWGGALAISFPAQLLPLPVLGRLWALHAAWYLVMRQTTVRLTSPGRRDRVDQFGETRMSFSAQESTITESGQVPGGWFLGA